MGITTTIIPQQIDISTIVDNETILYNGTTKKIEVDMNYILILKEVGFL